MPYYNDPAPPMTKEPHTQWFHGSPLRLTTLAQGSTITPVKELAKVFSHKPSSVSIGIRESDSGTSVELEHNGIKHGYLYRVLVDSPTEDLIQHPGSGFAPGEEMLTTRDLPLEFLEEVPI